LEEKSEIVDSKVDIDNKTRENLLLKDQITNTKGETEDTAVLSRSMNRKNKDLELSISNLKDDIVDESEAKKKMLEDTSKDFEKKVGVLGEKHVLKKDKIAKEITDSINKKEDLEDEKVKQEKEAQKLETKKRFLERSNNKTKIQVENAEKAKSEIQSKKSELERTLFSAQEYLNEEKKENKSVQDKNKKIERDTKKKLSDSKSEKERIEDLQAQRQQALDQQLQFQTKLSQTEK